MSVFKTIFIFLLFLIPFVIFGVDTEPVVQSPQQPYFTIIGAVSALLGGLGGSYAVIGKWLQKFVDNQDAVLKEIKQVKDDVAIIKAKKF